MKTRKLLDFQKFVFLVIVIILSNIILAEESSDLLYLKYKQAILKRNLDNRRMSEDASSKVILKVLTYNIGLLENVFYAVANYQARSNYLYNGLSDFIIRENPDVLCLQEVWYWIDFKNVLAVARDHDYYAVERDYDNGGHHHGLQILVKKSLLGNVPPAINNFIIYKDPDGNFIRSYFEEASKTWRGILITKIPLIALGEEVLIVNTHLTPFITYASMRTDQLKSMLRTIENLTNYDHIVVAGDFNVATDYLIRTGDDIIEWQRGREVYFDFFKRTGLIDSFLSLNINTSGVTYSCNNPLAHLDAPTRRLDYIFAGKKFGDLEEQTGLFVDNHRIVFDENIVLARYLDSDDNGRAGVLKKVPLSDHYGVLADITFFQ